MPNIEQYGQPRVATERLPSVGVSSNAPSAAFGVPHNVDVSGVAQTVSSIAQDAKQRADQVAVSAADAQIVRAKTARLWDPQVGAMNARGKDAIPASDMATEGFMKDAADIEQGLSNDDQKEAFRRRVDMHYADLGGQLGQHVATQIKQYDTDTTDGHVDALADAAVKSYQNDQTVQQSVDGARALLTDYFRANGHGNGTGVDDFAQQHIAQRVSAIRAAVLGQYATAGQSDAASAYFTAHKEEFVGKDLTTAQKIVAIGGAQSAGQSMARKILGIGQPDPLPGDPAPVVAKTMTEALAAAEKIPDDDQRDEATKTIVSHFTHMETAGRLDREAAAARVTAKMEAAGGRLNKADPDYQALVGHPEEEHVLHHQDEILRPPKDPGDPEAFLGKVNLASLNAESRKLFLQETPKDWDGMNTAQKTHLVTLQKQYRAEAEHAVTADLKHDLYAAESAAKQYGDQADAAHRKDDVEGYQDAKRKQNIALGKMAELRAKVNAAPAKPSGDVDLGAPAKPVVSALPVVHPTQQQLERISRDRMLGDTRYEQYFLSVGGVLPKAIPTFAAPKP